MISNWASHWSISSSRQWSMSSILKCNLGKSWNIIVCLLYGTCGIHVCPTPSSPNTMEFSTPVGTATCPILIWVSNICLCCRICLFTPYNLIWPEGVEVKLEDSQSRLLPLSCSNWSWLSLVRVFDCFELPISFVMSKTLLHSSIWFKNWCTCRTFIFWITPGSPNIMVFFISVVVITSFFPIWLLKEWLFPLMEFKLCERNSSKINGLLTTV